MTKEMRFWENKLLSELSFAEWESLCDGCGKCCTLPLQDDDTEQLFRTNIACQLFDSQRCRCLSYENRAELEPNCFIMDQQNIAESVAFAPDTCAYKRLFEGKNLLSWHPLLSGDADSVHHAGVSVQNQTVAMADVDPDDLEDYIIENCDADN